MSFLFVFQSTANGQYNSLPPLSSVKYPAIYDFARKLWISVRNRDRVTFSRRMESHANISHLRAEHSICSVEKFSRKILKSLKRLLLFVSFFNDPINRAHWMHSTSTTQKNATSRATIVSALQFSTLRDSKHLYRDARRHYRIRRSTKIRGRESMMAGDNRSLLYRKTNELCVCGFLEASSRVLWFEFDSRHADNHIINWKFDLEWYISRLADR